MKTSRNIKQLENIVKKYLLECRPGDLNHSLRVVEWVKKLGKDRLDLDILIISAYLHDIGWYKILLNNDKISKSAMKLLEPKANQNTEPTVRVILNKLDDSSININVILRLIDAADNHKSNAKDEAIIVDADNLSKLNINHVSEKYQPESWLKMYSLWKATFVDRIQTELGKQLYPGLLKQLKHDIDKSLANQVV